MSLPEREAIRTEHHDDLDMDAVLAEVAAEAAGELPAAEPVRPDPARGWTLYRAELVAHRQTRRHLAKARRDLTRMIDMLSAIPLGQERAELADVLATRGFARKGEAA